MSVNFNPIAEELLCGQPRFRRFPNKGWTFGAVFSGRNSADTNTVIGGL
jgi:hypothetical protein